MPDGTNQILLTSGQRSDENPSWSPDGTKIAFDSYQQGNCDIYVMNADGSGEIRLTNNEGTNVSPSWSPDGKTIIFVSDRDDTRRSRTMEIYVMNADGSNQTRITFNKAHASFPKYSPSGNEVVFQSDLSGSPEIYTMEANGKSIIKLTDNGPAFYNRMPDWSPVGNKIVFVSDRDNYDMEIYVMNTDGSDQVRLTESKWADMMPS
jgi:Tol biopolymer transport system component